MQRLKVGAVRARFEMSAISAAAAVLIGVFSAPAAFAMPGLSKTLIQPAVHDLGAAAPGLVKTLTISLAMRNAAALDPLVASVSDPASANFRQFMTPAQFAAQFGQSDATVAQVVGYLKAQGFSIDKVHASKLLITAHATNAQINAAFGTTVHAYSQANVRYDAPATAAVIPASLKGIVSAVSGLSNKPIFKSRLAVVPRTGSLAGDVSTAAVLPRAGAIATGVPGSYTVGDVAIKYNINPLYTKGYTGAGKTIGIATLAGYDQSDAYAYWEQVGLSVLPKRIIDVLVDGGALPDDGPGSRGATETTLDVEQSGGIAPGADMRVYIAPNTNAGFVDVFAQAINENLVDVLSISWGGAEIGNDDNDVATFHAIFAQAALQGIPVIAASGDSGAYDIAGAGYAYPHCSALLSVDFPAAEPLVLAAGGTTLPNTVQHKFGPITVPTERAWGWDYLRNYIVTYYGQDLYYTDYFTVGGGGGVSVDYAVPPWQTGLPGLTKSASAQSLLCDNTITGAGYQILATLPSGAAGRNLPDVSLNADPYSGYLLYFGGQFGSGNGGTSFVSPQLNGILTLISEGIKPTAKNPAGRVGFPAPQLYKAFKAVGYASGSPFKAISAGTNQFYAATPSFNPATGLGSLDVDALATTLGATLSGK